MDIYLDHNATTPLDERVLEAMRPWLMGARGNPSSVHRPGRAAHAALETARTQVAALVNAEPTQVIFTAGGTEADNLALKGVCADTPSGRLLVGSIEHAAVQGPAEALAKQGWSVGTLPVDGEGRYHAEALKHLTTKQDVHLVTAMLANNETGVLQDVKALADIAHAAGALMHTDAVQAAGKIPVDFKALSVDLMTLSAHKINGPRGVGALLRDRRVDLVPLVHGGGQEEDLRAGTENLAGIVGFGAAAELAQKELGARARHARSLRDRLEAGLAGIAGLRVFSAAAERLPNTSQFAIPALAGEWLVMELDRRGIAVSSGSACHSGSDPPSHVLLALGVEPMLAKGALRVSFGLGNTEADVDACLAALKDIVAGVSKNIAAVGW